MNGGKIGDNSTANSAANSTANPSSRGYPKAYGRYILEERIAMGGMAEIFRARTATEGFEKRVCIKRVLPHFLEDEEFVTMFRDEARTAAKLQHANVVQVFDFGEEDSALYLAMELVDGNDLRRIMDASRKKRIAIHIGEAVQIAIDMCRGLHHAHGLGVVHRDVSPHNVLVSKVGEVKVTDFGIARAAERATHTSTGIVKGKVAYMSPEQAQGHPFDHRLDQFATGIVLWEMLTGTRLFTGESDVFILKKVLACEIPAPSSIRKDVPPALDEIVLTALSRYADDRYRDMRSMELALQRFLFSGAIDSSTTEVRNIFTRIMQAQELAMRKTQIADAAEIAAASAAQDALQGTQPPAQQGAQQMDLEPSSTEMSKTKTESQPNVEAPGRSFSADAAVSSTGPEVSNVFSSSDKMPKSPSPTDQGGQAGLPSGKVPRASREVDPNALTVMEVNESDIPSAPDPVLSPVSSGKHVPAPSALPETISDPALPSVAELQRLDDASQPLSPAPDATPATRTNVPKSGASTTAPGSSEPQSAEAASVAVTTSPTNAKFTTDIVPKRKLRSDDDAPLIEAPEDAPQRARLPMAAGAFVAVGLVAFGVWGLFLRGDDTPTTVVLVQTPGTTTNPVAAPVAPLAPVDVVTPVGSIPVAPVFVEKVEVIDKPVVLEKPIDKPVLVEKPKVQKVRVAMRTTKSWFRSPVFGEVGREPTPVDLSVGKRTYKVLWRGEKPGTITLDVKPTGNGMFTLEE